MLKSGQVNWLKTSDIEAHINAEGVHNWPFDAKLPIAIRFLLMEPHPVRMNRHDYFELVYCHSGEHTIQVQERNFIVKKGDLFIMGSTLFHRPIWIGHKKPQAVCVFFLPELICQDWIVNDDATEYLMPFLIQDSSFAHVVPAKTGLPLQALHWIEQIHKEMPATSSEARLAVKTHLRVILMLLRKYYKDAQRTKGVFTKRNRDLQRLRPLFEFIDQHFAERITLRDAAAVVGISTSHFRRLFRQGTGQPFVTHLNHFRITTAQRSLILTDKSIAEVGQEVGFCDQSYFGIVFRKFVHMPPLLYRQRHRAR
jgi:AraC-like DNA-binding protein